MVSGCDTHVDSDLANRTPGRFLAVLGLAETDWQPPVVEVGVHLTAVGSQPDADMICSLLRVQGFRCGDRAADLPVYGAGGFGGWREILVSRDDLEAARELLATK